MAVRYSGCCDFVARRRPRVSLPADSPPETDEFSGAAAFAFLKARQGVRWQNAPKLPDDIMSPNPQSAQSWQLIENKELKRAIFSSQS